MAAATDFLHDEAVVDAVIAELTAHLPATWTDKSNTLWGLQRIEFGDLREYEPTDEEYADWLASICPCLLVRCNRVEPADAWSGMGGKAGEAVPVRVLHAFTRAQCVDVTSLAYIQPARARAQRAKIISTALWNDTTWHLGSPTLTTADNLAKVVSVDRGPTIYEGAEDFAALVGEVFGLAIDLVVNTRTE